MSDWQEYKLEQITEPVKDGFIPNAGDVRRYIGLEHIQQETLRLNSVGASSEVTSNKFAFNEGDVLFGKLRPYFRKVCKPRFSGVCSTDIWVFRAKKDFDPNWLFYFLADWNFVNTANGGDGGTRMPRADWGFLKSTSWVVPKFDEQKTIATVLSSLDDKIDLLHRQNATLEALAETLFRQWFVEEADENWGDKPLSDVCVIKNGFAFKSETYQNTGQRIIRTLNFSNGHVDLNNLVYISFDLAKSFEGYFLERKDFLLVMVGAGLGNFSIVTSEILPSLQNQNMWCFRAKEPTFQHYLNYALRAIIAENLHAAGGSARSFFQKASFYEQLIKIPDLSLVQRFNDRAESFFKKIELNRSELLKLTQLRETLLPKLISGEVRVRY